eukprot:scaffold36298_cov122-Isochrysis_galbana.AAC.18
MASATRVSPSQAPISKRNPRSGSAYALTNALPSPCPRREAPEKCRGTRGTSARPSGGGSKVRATSTRSASSAAVSNATLAASSRTRVAATPTTRSAASASRSSTVRLAIRRPSSSRAFSPPRTHARSSAASSSSLRGTCEGHGAGGGRGGRIDERGAPGGGRRRPGLAGRARPRIDATDTGGQAPLLPLTAAPALSPRAWPPSTPRAPPTNLLMRSGRLRLGIVQSIRHPGERLSSATKLGQEIGTGAARQDHSGRLRLRCQHRRRLAVYPDRSCEPARQRGVAAEQSGSRPDKR